MTFFPFKKTENRKSEGAQGTLRGALGLDTPSELLESFE
jgi:hypothetical protein